MRKKPWMEPELQTSGLFVPDPAARKGRWQDAFPKRQSTELEIGCGKCVSTSQMARANPDANYLAVDESRVILGIACRRMREGDGYPENLRLAAFDAMFIERYLASADQIERIHISFCNPWTMKSRHYKRRLTHTRQLLQYRAFLVPGGEIRFKTDDDALFADSLVYFREAGFDLAYRTDDLHGSGYAPNYVSEHEAMYVSQGMKIHFAIARMADRD